MFGKTRIGIFGVILVFFVTIVIVGVLYVNFYQITIRVTDKSEHIEIPPGASVSDTVNILSANNIIDRPLLVYIVGRIYSLFGTIKKGYYAFDSLLSLQQLYSLLLKGSGASIKFTVVGGQSAAQIFEALKGTDIKNKGQYADYFTDHELLNLTGIKDIVNLEGFLFPDTYFIPIVFNEKEVLQMMIKNFADKLPSEFYLRSTQHGLTPYKLLILASIVEKESGDDGDQANVASVYYNRLQAGMKLQADPTVIYGTKKFNKPITKSDLASNNPFNTYVNFGLPPTPIANFGLQSIYAVLEPAKTNYLYFVSKGDGKSEFSNSLTDHNRAVSKYQRKSK